MCERRTLATLQAEGRVAAENTADILTMMSQCRLGWGRSQAGSHDVFLDTWDEFLGVGVQVAVYLEVRGSDDISTLNLFLYEKMIHGFKGACSLVLAGAGC